MADAMPLPEPEPVLPEESWKHFALWKGVQEAIRALPAYFETKTHIEGILATDIFTLNAALGATIEEQVVSTLNAMRLVWDPQKEYQSYFFTRQSQTFPDVLLQRSDNGHEILMGIELKGWYLLAKEGMPNFRFVVNSNACNPQDLIVVVPWVLSNVLSGSPIVHRPWIQLAKYAALKRNYYWRHERDAQGNTEVVLAENVEPYPTKSDRISDKARSDSGGNFGRLARYRIMDDYVSEMMATQIQGIVAKDWFSFFRKQKEKRSRD